MAIINLSRICTGNNTIRTAWDPITKETLKTVSAGHLGLKGARRGTPYAAELVGREIGRILKEKASNKKIRHIYLAGKRMPISSGIRGLRNTIKDFRSIKYLNDVSPKPHNGCRARKPRRV